MDFEIGSVRRNRLLLYFAAAVVLASLNACSGDKDSGKDKRELVFDALGGGSPIIRVYPGPQDKPADKVYDGTYSDGDEVEADCKVEGRLVSLT